MSIIVPATVDHALKLDVRLPGLCEYWASQGVTHQDGITDLVRNAHEAWTWLTPEPGAIWGMTYHSLTDPPVAWLFPGPAVRERPREFLRGCAVSIKDLRTRYPLFAGYCNISFTESERWLRWLGARFEQPMQTGGLLMSKFHVG